MPYPARLPLLPELVLNALRRHLYSSEPCRWPVPNCSGSEDHNPYEPARKEARLLTPLLSPTHLLLFQCLAVG